MLEKLLSKRNSIHISIGEEGIAVIYIVDDQVSRKLFIRSNSEVDTIDLRRILLSDNNAMLHIYIDTLDQSYVKKILPAISIFNIDKLAKQRLEQEIDVNYLKCCLRVGRSEFGRKDWIYTFISVNPNPLIYNWLKFFEGYVNIIEGIYFLPIELSIIDKIFYEKITNKKSFIYKVKNFFKKEQKKAIINWSILVTINKTGGFRQVIFQDGKTTFSRLLNNLNDPKSEVIAGNIEQEIINSIEYLKRTNVNDNINIAIYIIVSQEIKLSIRKSRFNIQEIYIYTPYEAYNHLNIPKKIARENDRFCDPLILTLLHFNKERIAKIHTPETRKIFLYSRFVKYFSILLKSSIPIIFIYIIFSIYDMVEFINNIKNFETQQQYLSAVLEKKNFNKSQEAKEIEEQVNLKEIGEIVGLYNRQQQYYMDFILFLQKLGAINPDLMRINVAEISYNYPKLKYVSIGNSYEQLPINKQEVIGKYTVIFNNHQSTYEEINNNYKRYTENLIKEFNDYEVKISSLPLNFSFEDLKKPIILQVIIQTPVGK